jgi:hypothetical protein
MVTDLSDHCSAFAQHRLSNLIPAAALTADMNCMRREPSKVLIFSGCKSHPASGSLRPVAIEATRGGNETVGAFETDWSL